MKYESLYKNRGINLQLSTDDKTDDTDDTDQVDTTDTEPKTFTEEELQSETDRKVSKALETAKAKWEQEQKEVLKTTVEETERLAKLSEKEKQEELEKQRLEDIEEREQTLHRRTLELDAVEILSERKLPIKFKDILIGKDEASTLKNITNFEEEFKKSVQESVDDRLKTSTPRMGGEKETKEGSFGSRLAKNNSEPVKESNYFK